MIFEELYNYQPYALEVSDKEKLLLPYLNELSNYHYHNCQEYRNVIDVLLGGYKEAGTILDVPFLPVRLFKELDLYSVNRDEIIISRFRITIPYSYKHLNRMLFLGHQIFRYCTP